MARGKAPVLQSLTMGRRILIYFVDLISPRDERQLIWPMDCAAAFQNRSVFYGVKASGREVVFSAVPFRNRHTGPPRP